MSRSIADIPRERISQAELHRRLGKQGVSGPLDYAFVCATCGTVQSGRLFRAAGVSLKDTARAIGFSCVGRFTGAGEYKPGEPPGRGCNWSLGGLFRFHRLEIELPDGKVVPFFEPSTPEQAQELARSLA